jgi:hypothetical protein
LGRCTRVHGAAIAGAALSFAALALPVVVVGPGCLACDDSVCESRLVIVFREPDGAALSPGLWDFEFVADGVTRVAACEIGPDSRSSDCEPGDVNVRPIISDDPDNPFTWFQVELASGETSDDLPTLVEVSVVHNGTVIVDERLEPDYELVEPKRCDPDCVSDHFELLADRE